MNMNNKKILENSITLEELDKKMNWSKEDWNDINAEADYLGILYELMEFKQKKRISNAEISRRTGITRPELTMIFNGKRNATLSTINKIAYAFNRKMKLQLVSI